MAFYSLEDQAEALESAYRVINKLSPIVRDLAACEPPTVDNQQIDAMQCVLCGHTWAYCENSGSVVDHETTCPWRRAKELQP